MSSENPLNTRLCDILVDFGIDAEAEVIQPDKSRIDVRCHIPPHTIAIEAEHGYSDAKMREAIRDADDKLKRQVCDVAIALVYPDDYRTRRDLENGEVKVSVRAPGRQPKAAQTKWRQIKVTDLAGYVRQVPNELGSPEALAKKANVAINTAAAKFTAAAEADSILAEMGEAAQGTNVKGLMTDLLTAIMFHTKLDTIRHSQKPELDARTDGPLAYTGIWPPQSVTECLRSDQVAQAIHNAHDLWLAVDYKQILEWSCAIINALPNTSASNAVVEIIAKAAVDIQRTSGNQHHDLVGITFCQSVETAQSDGSMYTTIPAATLLTALLFEEARINWADFEQVTSIRIVDFACGTGTLLIAAANYILQSEQTGRPDEVAKAILEQVVYGFDINNRAVFQTATGLGMIAPSVAFSKMHLYSMVLGIDGSKDPKLGSLELLEDTWQLSLNPRPTTGTRIDSTPAPIETETFDMAIMNPPYTRGDIRHKQLSQHVEKKLRQREAQLYEDMPMDQTSNANGFFVLAAKHLNGTGGRLAFVAPTAMATNPSASKTRCHLAECFHIKYIVVSYDPTRIYQSGNTQIGEMLVIMERNGGDHTLPTTVVKLTTNPATTSDAVACASSIINGQIAERRWGIVDYVDPHDIKEGNWNAVQFVSNKLYQIARQMPWQGILGNQVVIGPMGRAIRNARKCNANDINATPVLYDHDVNHCNKLEVEPDCYVNPPPSKPSLINTLRKANYLHLAERIRLTTVKCTACRTTLPAVSSAWTTASIVHLNHIDDSTAEKAIVMILNSTPGKLGMLLVRSNKIPSYPQFSKDGLERIPMPRLSELTVRQLTGLADAYDELATQERAPLPKAHECPVQLAIDEAVCRYTDFDSATCEAARHLLAQEPMVTGEPYQFATTQ